MRPERGGRDQRTSKRISDLRVSERTTGFEPATPTLAKKRGGIHLSAVTPQMLRSDQFTQGRWAQHLELPAPTWISPKKNWMADVSCVSAGLTSVPELHILGALVSFSRDRCSRPPFRWLFRWCTWGLPPAQTGGPGTIASARLTTPTSSSTFASRRPQAAAGLVRLGAELPLLEVERQPLVLRRQDELLGRRRTVQAQTRVRADVVWRPSAAAPLERPPREHGHASLVLPRGGHLLGPSGQVDGPARAHRDGRVEDDDADLGADGDVLRMTCAGLRDPEELAVRRGRVPDRRRPGQSVCIGRAERHVAVAVDDGSRHRLAFGEIHQAGDATPMAWSPADGEGST